MSAAPDRAPPLSGALSSFPSGWELCAAYRAPARAERSTLRTLLAQAAGTAFAREHGLSPSASLAAYKERVPIRAYDDLAPWIARAHAGEPAVLTNEPIRMFARTSGARAAPKLVPVTAAQARALAHMQDVWLRMALHDDPAAGAARILVLTSPADEATLPSGVPVGSLTGAGLARDLGFGAKGAVRRPGAPNVDEALHGRLLALPRPIQDVEDHDERLRLGLLHALGHDLSMIVATAPSTLVVLFDRLRALGRSPRAAWPSLRLLGAWRAGPSALYLPRLDELAGGLPVRDVGWAASEGWFAATLEPRSTAACLALSRCLFEFLPEDAPVRPDATTLSAAELEPGRRYRAIVTTPGGLYRYDTEDIVEAVDRFEGAARVAFCRRAGAVCSMAGEKLTEAQVVEAVRRAALHAPVHDFLAEPVWAPPGRGLPHYRFRVAFVGRAPEGAAAEHLARALDDALGDVNIEYARKRRSGRLDPAAIVAAPADVFDALRRQRAAAGTPDAQNKPWHLRSWSPSSSPRMLNP